MRIPNKAIIVGSLIMRWENGSGLNVVYGEDLVRKVAAGGE